MSGLKKHAQNKLGRSFILLGLLGFSLSSAQVPPTASNSPHIFLLILENHSYGQVIGNPNLPTLNALAKRGALARNYTGVTHPSLPNYVALIAGSTMNMVGDDPAQSFVGATLASQLADQRLTWKGYMQGLPAAGSNVNYAGLYGKKHNPFMLSSDLVKQPKQLANVVPFEQLQTDLQRGQVPNFSLLVPDLCHDLHGDLRCLGRANVERTGDAFVKKWADQIMASSVWKPGAALIITFDEGEDQQGGGGRVATILLTPGGQGGKVSDQPYNHYSLLRSMEDHLGVPPLREAARATPMSDLWP
ncbi:hypothetical protein EHF33_06800 [Deinococcus psychrotolerans]|uniref:Acid phosphatase n=1 Tax=Deinococcus psychrotolerans TaxID=2489213 RepID=A0A3G8YIW6_9DEIO|nr:alkaline phosphatase family protein [Deinococcus psychrotolerans]AZI42494.1 hypothetical protein EHF33_06800 [Deinococcus psychrotolerans]